MKNYKKQDIKIAKFILENCETVTVPRDCFKRMDLDYTKEGYEVNVHIIDNGKVDGYLFGNRSPLQRLNYYDDICSIELKLNDDSEVEIDTVWNNEDGQTNSFQKSKLNGYRELKLSIDKHNRELTIYDVLKLPHGTIVIDDNSKEYKVEEDDKCKYLFDTYFTDEVLYAKFKIKKDER